MFHHNISKINLFLSIILLVGLIVGSYRVIASNAQTLDRRATENSTLASSICHPALNQSSTISPEAFFSQQIPIHYHDHFSKFNLGLLESYRSKYPLRGSVYKVDGFEVSDPIFSLMNSSFSEGLVREGAYVDNDRASENFLHIGFLNKAGQFAIKPQFETAASFKEGLAYVEVDGKYGFVNHMGKLVIAPRFDNAKSFSEGLAPVRVGGRWGFINTASEMLISPEFQDYRPGMDFDLYKFSEGLAAVLVDNKVGYIDTSGRMAIQPQLDRGDKFSEGLARVDVKDRGTAFINASGQFVISPKFHAARSFSEGLAGVVVDESLPGKYGFINALGQLIIPPKFDYVEDFSEGFAAVRIGESWGYIDYSGEVVVPLLLSGASSFSEGIADISIDGYALGQPQDPNSGEIKAIGFITHWDVVHWLQKCKSQK